MRRNLDISVWLFFMRSLFLPWVATGRSMILIARGSAIIFNRRLISNDGIFTCSPCPSSLLHLEIGHVLCVINGGFGFRCVATYYLPELCSHWCTIRLPFTCETRDMLQRFRIYNHIHLKAHSMSYSLAPCGGSNSRAPPCCIQYVEHTGSHIMFSR
jgi:hypothetical protein